MSISDFNIGLKQLFAYRDTCQCSVVPNVFWAYWLNLSIVYLSGTEGTPPWLRALSENFSELRIPRLA